MKFDRVRLALEVSGLSNYFERFRSYNLDDELVGMCIDNPSLTPRLARIFVSQNHESQFKIAFRKIGAKVTVPRPDYDVPVQNPPRRDMSRRVMASPSRSTGSSQNSSNSGVVRRTMPESRSALKRIFDAVDRDKSGRIDAEELHRAFTTGGSATSLDACRLMISLFDDGQGTIDLIGFFCVTMLLGEWVTRFIRFDTDNSGYIDRRELLAPLQDMAKGYRISQKYVDMIVRKFGNSVKPGLDIDGFINACAFISSFTRGFREKDTRAIGSISYEDYLDVVINAWN